MKISLILTTRGGNRLSCLIKLLDSLTNQTYRNFKLILVDQNQENEICNIIEKYHQKFSIKYIKTEYLPLSVARNIGLQHFEGEIVAYPDDDCWYDENTLQQVANIFSSRPDIYGLCTMVKDPDKNLIYGHLRKKMKFGEYINIRTVFKYPISVGIFCKYNFNEQFDEMFGVGCKFGSGEETDYLLELINKNQKIICTPQIFVYHPVEAYTIDDIKKTEKYAYGIGALFAKSIIKRNQWRTLFEFFDLIIRSIGGWILNSLRNNKVKNAVYKNRLIGLIKGYKEGLTIFK